MTIIGVFQGLAITLVSDEGDAKILNEVQDRFDVNITELPDEIDLSSYSKLIGVEVLSCTLPDLRGTYILEGPALVGIQYTCGQLHMHVQGSLTDVHTAILEPDWPQRDHPAAFVITWQFFLPPKSHCPFIPARKNLAHISELLLFQFTFTSFFKKNIWLKLRKSG